MGAKHQQSLATISKKYAFDKVTLNAAALQKLQTYQGQAPPPYLPVAGGGQAIGSGASFPILYPIIDLGTQGANIVIQLARSNSHYQKMTLSNPGGPINVYFAGLIKGKSILFTLDVTIGTSSLPAINWPSTLNNIPVLPTSMGSRYLLHIIGYRDSSGERYEVLNTEGLSASVPWSAVTPIDVDKDMNDHGLSNLAFLNFHVTGNRVGMDSDGIGHVFNFYVDGKQIVTFSRNQAGFNPNQMVMELYDSYSSGQPAALKLGYLPVTPTTGFIGELDFDSYTTLNRQTSFGRVLGRAVQITDASPIGEIQFLVADGSGGISQVMNVEGGPNGITPKGLNLLDNILYGVNSVFFFNQGSTIFEEADAMDFETNSTVGQDIFRFKNGNTTIFELGPNEFKPFTGISLGDVSHFFLNSYIKQYFIGSGNQYLTWDGTGSLLFFQPANKVFQFQFGGVQKVTIDSNNNFVFLENGMSLEFLDILNNPAQLFKGAGNPFEVVCSQGIDLDAGNSILKLLNNSLQTLDFTPNEIKPYTSISLGDASHLFVNTYSQQYLIGSANQSLGWDGSGNLLFTLQNNKVFQWQFGSTDYVTIDSNNKFLEVTNGMGFRIIDTTSGVASIIKGSSLPMEIICSSGIQLDNNLLSMDSTQQLGVSAHPFLAANLLNLEIIDGSSPSNNMILNIASHYVQWNLTNAAGLGNVGYTWQLGGVSWLSLIPDPVFGLPNLVLNIGQAGFYTSASAGTHAIPSLAARFLYLEVDGIAYKVALFLP